MCAKKKIEQNVEFTTDAMLKLENIKKDYYVGNNSEPVHALKGVNLNFRKNYSITLIFFE